MKSLISAFVISIFLAVGVFAQNTMTKQDTGGDKDKMTMSGKRQHRHHRHHRHHHRRHHKDMDKAKT